MTTPTLAAVVPMRHSSERVPGKNYRDFNGRPLFHHIIETLVAASTVDRVVIDTDSPIIVEQVHQHFEGLVEVLERPEHLRAGEIPMNEVLLNTVRSVEADAFLQTHSTNPLLRVETIDRAVRAYWEGQPAIDSVFSVTRLQTRLWWSATDAVNHDPDVLLRTQDLPPVYEENSNLYVFSRASLERSGNRIGHAPLMIEIDRAEAWDIDDELDFTVAQVLHERAGS